MSLRLQQCYLILLLTFIFISSVSSAGITDSLFAELKKTMHDTDRVKTLAILSWEHAQRSNYDSALHFGAQGLELSERIAYDKGIANSCNNIGGTHRNLGNYPEALKYFYKALRVADKSGSKKAAGNCYMNIALVYKLQGNLGEAMKLYSSALKIFIGANEKKSIGSCYNNMGIAFRLMGKPDEALQNYSNALKIAEEMGDRRGVAYAYSNMAVVYATKEDHKKALEIYLPLLKMAEKSGDKAFLASTHINIGLSRMKLKEYNAARTEFDEGLEIAKQINHKEWMQNAYQGLTTLDSTTGRWQQAFINQQLYMQTRDELKNDENIKKIEQQRLQYEFDKKDAQARAENEKKDLLNAEKQRKQQLISGILVAGLVLAILIAVFIFRSLRLNQRKNRIIIMQKREVELQKDIIEEKQKAILDSINYARRIQNALIPGEGIIRKTLARLKNGSLQG